jgi:methylenetetrahydrofolate reductase (NADPH)
VEDDSKAVEEIGIVWAREQCEDLVARGAPGIHFYTLNRSTATRRIVSDLRAAGSL